MRFWFQLKTEDLNQIPKGKKKKGFGRRGVIVGICHTLGEVLTNGLCRDIQFGVCTSGLGLDLCWVPKSF